MQREKYGREIPWGQRRPGRPDLATVVDAVASVAETTAAAIGHGRWGEARMLVALLGRREGGLRLRDIAEALGVDLARVSRLTAEGEARLETDAEFRTQVRRAVELCTKKQNSRPDSLDP